MSTPVEAGTPLARRILAVAAAYGAVAGAVAGLALTLMNGAQHLIWHGAQSSLRSAATILLGGVIIVLLRRKDHHLDTLDSLIAESEDPVAVHWRRTLHLCALGVVAVGFGGAVGPEAGLIAVVTELSAIVARRITSVQEQHDVGRFGTAAVLGGLYGSPPAAAAWDDDSLTDGKIPNLVAAVAGFLGFVVIHQATSGEHVALGLPTVGGGQEQMLWAFVPAAAGAAVAALFTAGQPLLGRWLDAVPAPSWVQAMLATTAVALLAAFIPQARFSGHEQMPEIADFIHDGAWATLAALACVKILATALSLRGGWLGGAIFPLIFAGGCAGAACLGLVPHLDAGTAVVAGLTAAAVVGLRKPLAALLLCAFVAGTGALIPLMVATLVGAVIARLLPEAEQH